VEKEKAPVKEQKVQVTMRIIESLDERIKNICGRNGASYNSLANVALDIGLRYLESEFNYQNPVK